MKTLDKKRPYGEVWGGNTNARYHQDGHYFDHEGRQLDELVDRDAAPGSGVAPSPLQAGPAPEEAGAVIDADVLLNARRGMLMPKAIVLLDGKSEDVVAELADHDTDMLEVMLEVEGLTKKRKGVTDAIAQALAAKAAQEQQDTAAANGQPIPPQVNAPSASFGTLSGENQLASQLQG